MKGKLYSFGCSFSSITYKEKCIRDFNYPNYKLYNELLSEKLNLELKCDAYEGAGNNSILIDLASQDFEDNSTIVVQLTYFHRLELRKSFNLPLLDSKISVSGPITSATIHHFGQDDQITEVHIQDYLNFVTSFHDILCFNDLFILDKIIQTKKKNQKNLKFICLTADEVNEKLFTTNKNLLDNITLNGFHKIGYETWSISDPHLNPNGNKKLTEDLFKIINYES